MLNKLQVSSGTEFFAPDIDLFRLLAEAQCIEWRDEPRLLHSGGSSRLYIHNRERLTDKLKGMIGHKIYAFAEKTMSDRGDRRTPCFIGVPDAATRLAMAARACSLIPNIRRINRPVAESAVLRKLKSPDEHWIDCAPDPKTYRYVLIEDALRRGTSMIEARDHLAEERFPLPQLLYLVFIDRQEGGVERLRESKIIPHVFYRILDILEVFLELGLWPKDHCLAARNEILASKKA